MVIQLRTYQAAVLAFLFDRLPIGDDVESLEFSLAGKFAGRYRVAHSAIGSADQIAHIVFTLPSHSRSVFLALTRSKLNETGRILANLEDYVRESSIQLKFGEVVVTPKEAQDGADTPYAVILLRTATSLDCAKVPDRQTIDSKETLFYLAVPLTREEWDLRRQRGHDALMDRFQEDEKELFFC